MIGGKPKVSDLVLGARNMIEAAEVLRSAATKNLILSWRNTDGKKADPSLRSG